MKKLLLLLPLLAGVINCFSQSVEIEVKSSFKKDFSKESAQLVSLIPGFKSSGNSEKDLTQTYGSYKKIKTKATGFFYTKQINGRWWIIDPEGYACVNMAVNSLPTSNVSRNYDLLQSLFYNGIGNFVQKEEQTIKYNKEHPKKMSYTRRLNFYQGYRSERKKHHSLPKDASHYKKHVILLDPEFEGFCDELASKITAYTNEKDLLGYFTDNEIPFNDDQLKYNITDLFEDDPSYKATVDFITKKGISVETIKNKYSSVPKEIKDEYAALLAEKYYEAVNKAIRKHDPNHLILGSRLHGRARGNLGVVRAAGKFMDVVSVNFYDTWEPDNLITSKAWLEAAGKPCVVGEFYTKNVNYYNDDQSGAGWYVKTDKERGYFYQNTCLELLKSKQFIGWHYFRFEDNKDSNKGIITTDNRLYEDMGELMKELNLQVYEICEFYDK